MAKGSDTVTVRTDPSARDLDKVYSRPQVAFLSVWVRNSINAVKLRLVSLTPRKSGKLVRSQKLVKVNDLEFKITEGVEYGHFIREGVPPPKINPIVPVRKKALYWKGARHPVARVKNHPGIQKYDYFQIALNQSEGDIQRNADRAVVDIEAGIDI